MCQQNMIQTQSSALPSHFSFSQVLSFHERHQPPQPIWPKSSHVLSQLLSLHPSLFSSALTKACLHSPQTTSYLTLISSLFSVCERFNFSTYVVLHNPAPRLPVTLPAQLPDPCYQSCSSLPVHSFRTGLKPLLPISWIMALMHTSMDCCVCVFV